MNKLTRLSGTKTEPMKLDLKDRKIMTILVEDARISLVQLSKRVGLKRDTVIYRIKKLRDKGLITGFAPIIDFEKLDYSFYEIFLVLDNDKESRRKKFIDEVEKLFEVKSILEYNDRWDIKLTVLVRDLKEFDKFNEKLGQRYSSLILEKERSAVIKGYSDSSIADIFLTGTKQKVARSEERKEFKIDTKDLNILKQLSIDCRQSTYQIGDKLKLSADGVNLRIKKLVQSGVIKKFTTIFDHSKLPIFWYTLAAQLKQFDPETERRIKHLVKTYPKIMSIRKTLGNWDIMISIVAKSHNEVHEIVKEIKKQLSNSMKNYQTWLAYKEHYFTPFPEILLGDDKD